MSSREIKLTLRFTKTSKEQEQAMIMAAKMGAKHLLTQAMLVSGARKPEVALEYGDMFATTEEINVVEVEDFE